MITKSERTELRSIVKQQFKVLRSELDQRQMEMQAEVEEQVDDKFADEDAKWQGVMHVIHEVAMDANRQVNDALYNAGYQTKGRTERIWIDTPHIAPPENNRANLKAAAWLRIRAQVQAAKLRLDREEADLLRTLAVGALESDEAHGFLSAIPTVAQLVPAARLVELEAAFGDDEDGP